jgi:hypothetical protein
MPKLNPYFIPNENYQKVAEIRYLEENQSTEQQAKIFDYFKERQDLITKKSQLSPAARSKIISKHGANYLSERAFTHDLTLMEMYGPGFWDELNRGEIGKAFDEISDQIGPAVLETTKFVGKVAGGMAVGGAIVATGGAAAPLIGAGVATSGYFFKKAAEQDDCPVVGYLADVAMGGGTGVVGSAVVGKAVSSSLASKGADLALNSALSNGSEELLRVWMYTKAAQTGYHLGSKSKQVLEGFANFYHGAHKGRGIEYESECPICNGNFDKYFWI